MGRLQTQLPLLLLGVVIVILLERSNAHHDLWEKSSTSTSTSSYCEWDVLDGSSPVVEEELVRLLSAGKPVLIRHASRGWKAKDWEEIQHLPLQDKTKSRTLGEYATKYMGAARNNANSTSVSSHCWEEDKGSPYIFEQATMGLQEGGKCWDAYATSSSKNDPDVAEFETSICTVLDKAPLPLLKSHLLSSDQREGMSSVAWTLGGPCSGLVFHRHTPAMALLLFGGKRWMVEPSSGSNDEKDLISEVYTTFSEDKKGSGGFDKGGEKRQWMDTYYPEADFAQDKWKFTGPPAAEPLHCVQRPGDLVFLPHYHYHAVLNVQDSFSTTYLPCLSFIDGLWGCRTGNAGLDEDEDEDEL